MSAGSALLKVQLTLNMEVEVEDALLQSFDAWPLEREYIV